ncbi:ABC transporter substrate-binding protein [Microvirga calopogonii]|uniref:ABC transporter substrate-binding protein n=1 Tax=Microvirga calopogonii TaxID=2078013 RepID=UPI001FDF8DD1|nr:ABC transporter substrate-binding protein [Microvirga calopogonii]
MCLNLVLWRHRPRDGKWRSISMRVLTCLVTVGFPALADAQSATHPRIGLLTWGACEMPDLIAGLKDLGRIPGENITIECRSAGKRYEGFATATAELVRLPVDVIVSESQPAGHMASSVTTTVPIVTILSGDPVGSGLVQSLSKPGGNLIGLTYYATELTAKRLELLQEAVPGISSVGVLANPVVAYLSFEEDTKHAAKALGLALIIHQVREPTELEKAIHQMKAEGAQAIFVLPDLMFASEAKQIADVALAEKLPVMAWGGWFTELGGLMAYSADYGTLVRRLAIYVDKILKGAPPGDLPIEQPAHFEVSVNVRTARTLGLTLPPELLARADEVIE